MSAGAIPLLLDAARAFEEDSITLSSVYLALKQLAANDESVKLVSCSSCLVCLTIVWSVRFECSLGPAARVMLRLRQDGEEPPFASMLNVMFFVARLHEDEKYTTRLPEMFVVQKLMETLEYSCETPNHRNTTIGVFFYRDHSVSRSQLKPSQYALALNRARQHPPRRQTDANSLPVSIHTAPCA